MKFIVFFSLIVFINQNALSRVIYGNDDRKDLYEERDSAIIAQAEATATFTLKGLIMPRGDGDYTIANISAGDSLRLCPEVRFREQPSIGACSATLVSPKHLLTAGHCMRDQNRCDEIYIMFGFHTMSEGEFPKVASAQNVYRCKKLLVRQQDSNTDFALIELDREVLDRSPVSLAINERVRKGDNVRLIGYPDGIPSKIVSGASVRISTNKKFVSNVDAFKGNSGSAIFSESTGNMVGVLFAGNIDYIYDQNRGCRKANVCKDNGCRGEDATHISSIWPYLSPYLE